MKLSISLSLTALEIWHHAFLFAITYMFNFLHTSYFILPCLLFTHLLDIVFLEIEVCTRHLVFLSPMKIISAIEVDRRNMTFWCIKLMGTSPLVILPTVLLNPILLVKFEFVALQHLLPPSGSFEPYLLRLKDGV